VDSVDTPEATGEAMAEVSTADVPLRRAAEIAGVSVKTLRRARARGALRCKWQARAGAGTGQLVVSVEELQRWMQGRQAGQGDRVDGVDNAAGSGQEGHAGTAAVSTAPALLTAVAAVVRVLEVQSERIALLEGRVAQLAGRLQQIEARQTEQGAQDRRRWWAWPWRGRSGQGHG
jgi:hypothetical protein